MDHGMEIQAELDVAHARGKQAFIDKDVDTYMDIFADDVSYKQFDGKVIGKKQLTQDVKRQLKYARFADSTYERESLEVSDNRATEVLKQTAVITMSALFFRRTWHVDRRGVYVWGKRIDGWQITHVEVLEEIVTGSKIGWLRLLLLLLVMLCAVLVLAVIVVVNLPGRLL